MFSIAMKQATCVVFSFKTIIAFLAVGEFVT